MILWCDGPHDPAENMRRDRALLERLTRAAAAGDDAGSEPVLRLFLFEPYGITLGHAQRPERVLDLERCRADGVPWAVRPTGGRAIFHAEEWTYSLCAALRDPDWGGALAEAYERASRVVHASLVRLGVPAVLAAERGTVGSDLGGPAVAGNRGATELQRDPSRARRLAAACFASTARHEIVLTGRKLVGSAQRRTGHALLQQGSILLGPGHVRLADYLAGDPEARAIARRTLSEGSALAGPHLGPDLGLEHWAGALSATLGDRARRVDGSAGTFLLTPPEAASYTPRGR